MSGVVRTYTHAWVPRRTRITPDPLSPFPARRRHAECYGDAPLHKVSLWCPGRHEKAQKKRETQAFFFNLLVTLSPCRKVP